MCFFSMAGFYVAWSLEVVLRRKKEKDESDEYYDQNTTNIKINTLNYSVKSDDNYARKSEQF